MTNANFFVARLRPPRGSDVREKSRLRRYSASWPSEREVSSGVLVLFFVLAVFFGITSPLPPLLVLVLSVIEADPLCTAPAPYLAANAGTSCRGETGHQTRGRNRPQPRASGQAAPTRRNAPCSSGSARLVLV